MLRAVIAVCLIGLLSFSPAGNAKSRVALVIGNGAYPASPLESPKLDKDAVAKKLRELDFFVIEKQDLTRPQFLEAIRKFGQALSAMPDTVGLFYYSGHGIQANNRNYMIPIDAVITGDLDVEGAGVALDGVLQRMQVATSSPNIVILDACRNNPFEKSYKSASQGNGLALVAPSPGTIVAYAAAPGRTALPGVGGELSAYTDALVKLIDEPRQDMFTTFRRVQDYVHLSTHGRQDPYVEVAPGVADFVFNTGPVSKSPGMTLEEDLIANVGDRVYFSYHSTDLSPEAKMSLDRLVAWLRKNPDLKVDITGNTEEREGPPKEALAVGTKRYLAAAQYLMSKGVDPSRIGGVSYGSSRPIASGRNEQAWAQNRVATISVRGP